MKKLSTLCVFNLIRFDPLPVTVENVREETQRNPALVHVYGMSSKRWLHNLDPALNPYFVRKDEIILQSGCLMWGISHNTSQVASLSSPGTS